MKKKGEGLGPNWLANTLEDIEKRRGDYVRSRFYVVEITPSKSYYQNDGHGGREVCWTRQTSIRVSGYFNIRAQAEHFFNAHEPDDGKILEIREDKLYRKIVETWH